MSLWGRQAEVNIGMSSAESVININGLRVTFDIKKTNTIMPNTAKIEIYNLSESTRNKIKERQSFILLRAGYTEDIGLQDAYKGTILRVTHQKRPPDVVTTIEAQDGIVQMQKRVSLGYPAGTSAVQILNDIIRQMGVARKSSSVMVQDRSFAGGFSTVGTAKDALTRITKYLGVEWSIQDNEIKFIPAGGSDNRGRLLISPESGLLESPIKVANVMPAVDLYNYQGNLLPTIGSGGGISFMAPGWKVKTLLFPTIEPKSRISIHSAAMPLNSTYIVETVSHKGDTHGGDWQSELDVYEARS